MGSKDRIKEFFGIGNSGLKRSIHCLLSEEIKKKKGKIVDITIRRDYFLEPKYRCLKALVEWDCFLFRNDPFRVKDEYLSFMSGTYEEQIELNNTHPFDLWIRHEVDYKQRDCYPTFEFLYYCEGRMIKRISLNGERILYNEVQAEIEYERLRREYTQPEIADEDEWCW